jgi:hypothetical protein
MQDLLQLARKEVEKERAREVRFPNRWRLLARYFLCHHQQEVDPTNLRNSKRFD